jgi:ferredoxin
MPTITFQPLGLSLPFDEGETVFQVARRSNVPIPTACVGRANCGLCRVKVLSGEESLSPINNDERRHLGNTYFITKLRLSCQARLLPNAGDVTVQIPDARRGAAFGGPSRSGMGG